MHYICYDMEGKQIAKGTAKECAYQLGLSLDMFWHCEKINLPTSWEEKERKIKRVRLIQKREKKKTRKEEKIDYLIRHLEEYGNTCLGREKESDVEEFISILKEKKGWDVVAEKSIYKPPAPHKIEITWILKRK